MGERYKISYFDQSFSRLYVRALTKGDDGSFACFAFWGVLEIQMAALFESSGQIVRTPTGVDTQEWFEFSGSGGQRVNAVQCVVGRCRDVPDVERVEFTPL